MDIGDLLDDEEEGEEEEEEGEYDDDDDDDDDREGSLHRNDGYYDVSQDNMVDNCERFVHNHHFL